MNTRNAFRPFIMLMIAGACTLGACAGMEQGVSGASGDAGSRALRQEIGRAVFGSGVLPCGSDVRRHAPAAPSTSGPRHVAHLHRTAAGSEKAAGGDEDLTAALLEAGPVTTEGD
jgi:hypothetical protein